MLKAIAAITAGCFLAVGASVGTAQAFGDGVEVRDASLIRCPGWAVEKKLCSRGEQAWRVVFSVPECWTVDVQPHPRKSGYSWTAERDDECKETKAKPRIVRVIVAA